MRQGTAPPSAGILRRVVTLGALLLALSCGASAQNVDYDRVASIATASDGPRSNRQTMIELIRALDRVTKSTTKVVFRPFARSLQETAAGRADFHFPLIEFDGVAAPEGLAYVDEVDFGRVQFVIYSRKDAPVDASALGRSGSVEVEAGHQELLPFPGNESNCIPCSLDKILIGRIDALVASTDAVDPVLSEPRYKKIHRSRYKGLRVRALVPVNADSAATRRYLADGMSELRSSGEYRRLAPSADQPYSDWQP